MSAHAFRIEGMDQVTHTPVRIELQLVTEAWGAAAERKAFAAPRGFLPTERLAKHADITPCQTSCQRQIGLGPDLAFGMAPRGFVPTAIPTAK
jgi:hypothetical protein